jgi:hypothetical protein
MIYEVEIGLFIQADSEDKAIEIVRDSTAMDRLEGLDYENSPYVQIVGQYEEEGFHG